MPRRHARFRFDPVLLRIDAFRHEPSCPRLRRGGECATAAPASASAASKRPVVARSVALVKGRAAAADDTLRFRRGDAVELTVSSDAPMDLHLHGYDLEASARPGQPARFAFVARLPGRFPISEHRHDARHHRSVLFIEVHP